MKNIINSILGKSPFQPMQEHAREIHLCVVSLKEFFKFLKSDRKKAEKMSRTISEYEHKADQIKDNIRNNLGKSFILPVNKGALLEILSIQDAIGDTAEDISVLGTIKENLSIPEELFTLMEIILDKSIDTFLRYKNVIENLDELLEATFTGPQAEKVRKEIREVACLEHETDRAQKIFLKKLFEYDEQLSKSDFFLIEKMTKRIGDIANISEKAANKIRLILLG